MRIAPSLLLALSLGLLVPPSHAALPGTLDPSFDEDGKRVDAFPDATSSVINAIRQQPDGKLVVAGFRRAGGGLPDMAFGRYNADGSRDTGFSGDGRQVVTFAGGASTAQALALTAEGKLVVAGLASNGNNFDITLLRLNTNGNVDNSFGTSGAVLTPVGAGNDGAYALVLQSDGRIKAAGFSAGPAGVGTDFALVGYKGNGQLDTAFGTEGKVVANLGGDDVALAMLQQPDGKFVLAGYSEGLASGLRQFALARFNTGGKLDTSFSSDGKVTTGFGSGSSSEIRSVLRLSGGKLLAVGCSRDSVASDDDIALARYNADGTLDTAFGNNGLRTTDIDGGNDCAFSVLQQWDGKLLVAGYGNVDGDDDVVLVRYLPNGTVDTDFGTNGRVVTPVVGGASQDRAYAALEQADGQVVAAGFAGTQLALVRYLFDDDDADGVVDTEDNCPRLANPDQANQDGDAFGNACDDDDDNDGVPDVDDAFPLDPAESVDTDGDGIGDNADPDDDNDGVLDEDDPFPLDPFLLNRISGSNKSDQAGYSVAMVGDVDGDGHADVLVGAPQTDVVLEPGKKAAANVGVAYLSSGQTLDILHAFTGAAKGDGFGSAVAVVGDVDNDGVPDLAIGAPYADQLDPVTGKVLAKDRGSVTVYSGASFAALYTLHGENAGDNFGHALAGMPDVDGDSRADLVVGAWKFDPVDPFTLKPLKDAGAAYLYSGQAGVLLQRFTGVAKGDYFGSSVAGGADLDHDAGLEIAVGAYRFDPPDPVSGKPLKDAGAVYVYRTTAPYPGVLRIDGAAKGDQFGYSVAVLNDGLDAFADLLVGAPRADVTPPGGKKLTDAGRAYLFDDASGGAALTVDAPVPQAKAAFGSAVAPAGDVDAVDGPDFVVGAPKADVMARDGSKLADAGQFSVHRAATGQPLFTFDGKTRKGQAGFAVAGGGDHNLDGHEDVVVGAPFAAYEGQAKAGTAEVISGKEASGAGIP